MHSTTRPPGGGSPRRDHYDVAVIGAGHNGLVCAFYLARAGYRVIVLERSSVVGGAAITEEFSPGFRNSVASYTVSLLQRTVIEEMKLATYGLEIVQRPMANFAPQTDGPGLKLFADVKRTVDAIAEHSIPDAERYPSFLRELAQLTRFLKSTMSESPIDLRGGAAEWSRGLQLLDRARKLLGVGQLATLKRVLTDSAGSWLDRWFQTPLLKGALGFDAVVGNFASPYAPSSGYLLLHHALGEANGVAGAWGHAIGGMGSITQAMARAVADLGVDVRVECEATRIEQSRSRFDVHLADGSVIDVAAVSGAIHPQTLFLGLLDSRTLPGGFVERMRNWKSESASFRLNFALSELPQFRCAPESGAAAHHGAGILISPSLKYLQSAYNDAVETGVSRRPVMELLIPSTIDPSLAPRGRHVASLFCQHFRRDLPGGDAWAEHKTSVVERIVSTIAEFAPNFPDAIVATQALSPEDLEHRFGLVGGDIFHGQMGLDQLYWSRPAKRYAQYRSPIKRIYLCASGAHPGGGVSGAPGRNAARAIIDDLAGSGAVRSQATTRPGS
ncbi:MAG: phytoene desaturase family protein [Gammaproteobacteria bacterium]